MKKLGFLLLLFAYLITYCFTYNCSNDFKTLKESQCTTIDSCHYLNPNTPNSNCVKYQTCSEGTSTTDCAAITPEDYHRYKCDYGSSCEHVKRTCNEFGSKQGDICNDLYPGAESGKRCDFSENDECTSYFDECNENLLNSQIFM